MECNGTLGTTIFADTSGYHRGKKLKNDKRLMLVSVLMPSFSAITLHLLLLIIKSNMLSCQC